MICSHFFSRSYKQIQVQMPLGKKKKENQCRAICFFLKFYLLHCCQCYSIFFQNRFSTISVYIYRTIIKCHYRRKKNLVIPLQVGFVSLLRRKKYTVLLQSTIHLNSLNKCESNTSCQKR